VNRVSILDADNTECTVGGDTQADVLAGLPAGVTVISYANKPGKAGAVASVQAAAVTTDLAAITTTLRLAPLESPDQCRTEPY
jgi:beta-phosphoglucomutase-like phosphatase (HAD superfamily)